MPKFKINDTEFSIKTRPLDLQNVEEIGQELYASKVRGKYSNKSIGLAQNDLITAFNITKNYVKKKSKILYGGLALDQYIPFIKTSDSVRPLIQFFSKTMLDDAVYLVEEFKKSGYKYSSFKTIDYFKCLVFADYVLIAEITREYSNLTFRRLNGFNIVSPSFLQMQSFKELSRPIDNPIRWSTISLQQQLLKNWGYPKFKYKQCSGDFITDNSTNNVLLIQKYPELENVVKILKEFAIKEKMIFTGAFAYNKYLELGDAKMRIQNYFYELLTLDAVKMTQLLKEQIENVLGEKLTTTIEYTTSIDNFGEPKICFILLYKQLAICSIQHLTNCVSYKYIGNAFYASIDYLFYELYKYQQPDKKYESCLIRYLQYIQQRYYSKHNVTEFDNTPFQRYIKNCKGRYIDINRELQRTQGTKGIQSSGKKGRDQLSKPNVLLGKEKDQLSKPNVLLGKEKDQLSKPNVLLGNEQTPDFLPQIPMDTEFNVTKTIVFV